MKINDEPLCETHMQQGMAEVADLLADLATGIKHRLNNP